MITEEIKEVSSDRFELFWASDFLRDHIESHEADHHSKESFEKWFNKIDSSHEKIRKVIGGHDCIVESKINIKPDGKFVIEDKEVQDFIYSFKYWNSDFVNEYKITDENIILNKIDKTKLTKLYSKWCDAKNVGDDYKNEYLNVLSTIINDIGRPSEEGDIKIFSLVSTTPEAFLSLGSHKGIDEESCFGAGGENSHHKYNLANSSETFVVLFGQDLDSEHKRVSGRCIGQYYQGKTKRVMFHNFYPSVKPNRDMVLEQLSKFLLNKDKVHKILDVKYNTSRSAVYINPGSFICFSDKPMSSQPSVTYKKSILGGL